MANPKFDREHAVRAIADATVMGDKEACKLHGISTATIYRYREKLRGSPDLIEAEKRKSAQLNREYNMQRAHFLAEGFAKLRSLIHEADGTQIRDVAGALKIAGELHTTAALISDEQQDEQRPARRNQPAGPAEGSPCNSDGEAGEVPPAFLVN